MHAKSPTQGANQNAFQSVNQWASHGASQSASQGTSQVVIQDASQGPIKGASQALSKIKLSSLVLVRPHVSACFRALVKKIDLGSYLGANLAREINHK